MKELFFILLGLILISCNESEIDDMNDKIPVPYDPGELTSDVVIRGDDFGGKKIILAGNAKDQYIVSFERELDGKLLEFTQSDDPLPIIMEDNEGNKWDIFGFAVKGPRKGQRLKPTQSLMGYWFSFATFYPGIQIYTELEEGEFAGKQITGSGGWLVPENEVRSGGVGRDGIPAVSDPKFDNTQQVSYLDNEDLVVGFTNGNSVVAYPHDVLDWHEIVNDNLGEISYSIIYCPLTGTATAWDRKINGKITTFGVSGLLYNTNIVPYDRETESNWSQLFDAAVWGMLKGRKPTNYMVLETTWETWKKLFPDSNVMNINTGYNRNYGSYPYGSYKDDEYLLFPVKYLDKRLHEKERVHTIIVNGKARAYRFSNFTAR